MGNRYEIRVAGAFSGRMAEDFAEFTTAVRPMETVICGDVRDQAELHGVLDRLQQFGLELVAVTRLPDTGA